MNMRKIVVFSFIMLEVGFSNLYGQDLSLRIDSLVISSHPWQLSPGMFGRSEEEIRGNNMIVIKDSVSISEFIKCVEKGLNTSGGTDFYMDPSVVIDIYCGQTFFSVLVDRDQRCRYINQKMVEGNRPLFKWVTKYVPIKLN